MRLRAIATSMLLPAASSLLLAQGGQHAPKHDLKQCAPRVVNQRYAKQPDAIHVHPGQKVTGIDPIVAFDILESGRITKARVKRTSGSAEIDAYALRWIRSTEFGPRLGCGVLQAEVAVTIDFR